MENLEQRTVEELKRGYCYDREQGCYYCLECGERFEEGEIFCLGGRFFEAGRAVKAHCRLAHGSRLEAVLAGESKYLALTAGQQELLRALAAGLTDAQIAQKSGTALSTVRHQRFSLREKAKRAKLYLAVYELAMEGKAEMDNLIPIHGGAKMIDDRYMITEEERQKILGNVFSSLEPLKLKVLSAKEKKKIVILTKIVEQFEEGRNYTEPEVNEILMGIYPDYVSLRRHLIEYGFMERTPDGGRYWKKR